MSTIQPAVTASKKLLTAEEFWDFCQRPENENKSLELVRGEVIELPRPTRRHGVVASAIAFLLNSYIREAKRGYVTANGAGVPLEVCPDTVVGPDVAYFTDANRFDDVHPKWGEVPPVLAVEVLSPNDKMTRVNGKIRDYLNNGVKVVWVVDYEEKKVSVYRPGKTLEVLDESAELSGGDDLPGLSVRVADFFRLSSDLPPTPPAA